MDEFELDEWFNEQREALETSVLEKLQDSKNPDAIKKKFDEDYRALIVSFQKKQRQAYEHNRRARQIQKPIEKFNSAVKEKVSILNDYISSMKESFRRWRFNRKIKRIINDKSDLFIR